MVEARKRFVELEQKYGPGVEYKRYVPKEDPKEPAVGQAGYMRSNPWIGIEIIDVRKRLCAVDVRERGEYEGNAVFSFGYIK